MNTCFSKSPIIHFNLEKMYLFFFFFFRDSTGLKFISSPKIRRKSATSNLRHNLQLTSTTFSMNRILTTTTKNLATHRSGLRLGDAAASVELSGGCTLVQLHVLVSQKKNDACAVRTETVSSIVVWLFAGESWSAKLERKCAPESQTQRSGHPLVCRSPEAEDVKAMFARSR